MLIVPGSAQHDRKILCWGLTRPSIIDREISHFSRHWSIPSSFPQLHFHRSRYYWVQYQVAKLKTRSEVSCHAIKNYLLWREASLRAVFQRKFWAEARTSFFGFDANLRFALLSSLSFLLWLWDGDNTVCCFANSCFVIILFVSSRLSKENILYICWSQIVQRSSTRG